MHTHRFLLLYCTLKWIELQNLFSWVLLHINKTSYLLPQRICWKKMEKWKFEKHIASYWHTCWSISFNKFRPSLHSSQLPINLSTFFSLVVEIHWNGVWNEYVYRNKKTCFEHMEWMYSFKLRCRLCWERLTSQQNGIKSTFKIETPSNHVLEVMQIVVGIERLTNGIEFEGNLSCPCVRWSHHSLCQMAIDELMVMFQIRYEVWMVFLIIPEYIPNK